MVPMPGSQWAETLLEFFAASGSIVLTTSAISGASAKDERARSLGEVEDVVDESEEMPGCAEHAVERLQVLLQRFRILPQHLADADDGIERRAQLMAHIGEELG